MSKILEVLAFVQEAKSGNELERQFGKTVYSPLKRLVEKGSVRKFKAFNEDSADKHARVVVTLYEATGSPYALYQR